MAWYDKITPEEAKEFLNSPLQTKVVGTDSYGRDIITQVNPLSWRAIEALKAKAGLV